MPFHPAITTPEIQDFIRSDHAAKAVANGLFSSPFPGITPAEIAQQVTSYRKALEKLPSLAAVKGIVYPPTISMEQCSGELAARYKAAVVPPGERMADITGGFGIDTLALSEKFRQTEYYETNARLAEIVRHNISTLQRTDIRVQSTDGIAAVTANGNRYDLIYADPARRDANAHRVFSVSDCTPDIAAAKERLLQCSPRLLVKLSPMLDITSTLRLLPETSQVHAVAVRGEIKELLFLLERGYHDLPCISAVDLRGADKPIRLFSARYSQCEKPPIAPADQYVYDPSATLRKTGLADAYCAGLGLGKLHPQTMLYTASRRVEDFQGRVFRTIGTVDKKNIIERFPDRRAAVVVRNYPGTAAEIARKYKLATSDRHFLLAFRDAQNKNTLLAVERIDLCASSPD